MLIFAIICLMIILLTIQHLLNWGWRNANNHSDPGASVIMFILSVIATGVTALCIYHITLWLYPLIKT